MPSKVKPRRKAAAFDASAIGAMNGNRRCSERPSRAAALRLGFTFEGIFRQATVYKGRSRDTAWFSILDREWPLLKEAYLNWLAPENFDETGCQVKRLGDLIKG